MAEYIDKQEVLADLNKTYDKMASFHPQFYSGYQFAANMLRGFPKADVAEVRHGRWLDGQCSECKQFDCADPFGSRYCPHCGARMDGGADNGE